MTCFRLRFQTCMDKVCIKSADFIQCIAKLSYYAHCTMYCVQCDVYNVLCTLYRVLCTMYFVQCTVNNVQCIVYDIPIDKHRIYNNNSWLTKYH